MPRRLIVLFDGTWSKAQTRTNVERLWKQIAATDATGDPQITTYIPGVGVKPGLEHLLGGAFGLGLSANIKQGFQWLSRQWRDGDEIWLFGFSRGAYSARSLGGMLRKCGLLRADANAGVTPAAVNAAYALYRNALHPDDPAAVAFRAAHSREVTIHFIGVWETVGELGIPGVGAWFPFSRKRYRFHDTSLSHIVRHAYQALALDEHRADFKPTKWTRPSGAAATVPKPGQIAVEQRWFVGAHSDVGGGEATDGAGHSPDTLPEIPLAWMQAKAAAAGLAFNLPFTPSAGAELDVPNHSYATFMYGLYKLLHRPYQRVLGGGVNETIDPSVWMKWYVQTDYRPQSVTAAMTADVIELGSSRIA